MARSFTMDGTAYPGGKGKSFQHVVNVMPPHVRYVETHLGAGAVMRNKRPAAVNIGIELDDRVVAAWSRRPDAAFQLIHGDAMDVLPSLRLGPGDLVYCDPPYLPATRRRYPTYRHDATADDHVRLLDMLVSLRCHVVLSGYPNALYENRLEGWSRTAFRTQTHSGTADEVLWTNFPPGDILHDYSYVGGCFRERERLRRRIGTLSARLGDIGELERNAALAAIADRYPEAVLRAAERLG